MMNKSVHEGDADQAAASARGPGGKGMPRSEMDALRAENARLRLALDEAQMKLRLLSVSRVPDENGYHPVASKRETGNGGVVYVQMRRLLLKDETFLRTNFFAFFNIVDLGRCSAVCRVFKKSAYNCSVVMRCVESGGVTDSTRGLLWLIMVGMLPSGGGTKGVLSVVVNQKPERVEEQYDRLHRAMNGTAADVSGSPAGAPPSGGNVYGDGGTSPGKRGAIDTDRGGDAPSPPARRVTPGKRNQSAESAGSVDVSGGSEDGGPGEGCAVTGDGAVLRESAYRRVTNGSYRVDLEEQTSSGGIVKGGEAAGVARVRRGSGRTTAGSTAPMTGAVGGVFEAIHDAGLSGSKGSPSVSIVEEVPDEDHGVAGKVSVTEPLFAGDGDVDNVRPSPPPAAPSVVGWASGLFRRSTSSSPVTVPSMLPGAVAAFEQPLSPGPERGRSPKRDAMGHHRQDSGGSTSATSPGSSSRISRGLLFGLRYARYTKPKSELPADSSHPLSIGRRFFGEGLGRGREGGGGTGGAAGDDRLQGRKSEGAEDGSAPVERVPGLYSALLNGADAMDANDITGVRGPKQSCFVDIEKDVKRTLGMSDVTGLRNVLRCTSTFVPDVGYVQGMNFVCRCLLQVFNDEEEAFWVFVSMLQRFQLRRLYCPGMPLLRLRFFQLSRLLMWHLPGLYGHFEACGVTADLFATSWFVTLLSDGGMLPDKEVKVLWDRVFLHASSPASQWASIFLVLLELLRRAEDTLRMESRFSELIHRLVNMPFRELCMGRGACAMMEEAGRRFETSSPIAVQLLLLHDQWIEGGDQEPNAGEFDEERQLM